MQECIKKLRSTQKEIENLSALIETTPKLNESQLKEFQTNLDTLLKQHHEYAQRLRELSVDSGEKDDAQGLESSGNWELVTDMVKTANSSSETICVEDKDGAKTTSVDAVTNDSTDNKFTKVSPDVIVTKPPTKFKVPTTLEECQATFTVWKSMYPKTKLEEFYTEYAEIIALPIFQECCLEFSKNLLLKDDELVTFEELDDKWSFILTGALRQALGDLRK